MGLNGRQAVDFHSLSADRIVDLGGFGLGVLICGEMMLGVYGRGRPFARFRHIVDSADGVVDISHGNVPVRGLTRWSTAIEDIAQAGVGNRSVVIAQHLKIEYLERRSTEWTDDGEVSRLASAAAQHEHRVSVGRYADTDYPAAVVDVFRMNVTHRP